MSEPLYKDAEWLERKYHQEGLSQREIAEECGASPGTIHRWMVKQDIERRTKSEANSGERNPFWGVSRDLSEEHKQRMSECRMGENHHFYGKEHSEETKQKISDALKQTPQTEAQIKNLEEWREYVSENGYPQEARENMSEAKLGESNPNWVGGHSPYDSALWEEVRKEALKRADFTCEHPDCSRSSDEIGHNPHTHHIIPARLFDEIEEAHTLDNLLVLCPHHHQKLEHKTRLFNKTNGKTEC